MTNFLFCFETERLFFSQKGKTRVPRRLIHCFLEIRRNKVFGEQGKWHYLWTNKMLFAVKRSDYFLARKNDFCCKMERFLFLCQNKTHAQRRLTRCFFESGRHKVIQKKGKLHNSLSDKMLFAVKQSDCFYAGKATRTFFSGWSTSLSKAKEI